MTAILKNLNGCRVEDKAGRFSADSGDGTGNTGALYKGAMSAGHQENCQEAAGTPGGGRLNRVDAGAVAEGGGR